jgi:alpha-tubulin suppressor-like RCC1 family protein
MSEIVNKFNVLNGLSDEFKQNIYLFYIFGDFDRRTETFTGKKNVLIVTKNDEVYAFGGNSSGVLGLGHENFVLKPTIVNELCDKNIVDFKSGWNHCMARTYYGKIYNFGMNFCGHLGIGKIDDERTFHKPELVKYLSDITISDMCCGGGHTIVLTNSGGVFAWGVNNYGQIGIENEGKVQLAPIKLIGFNNKSVVKITTGNNHSLALTEFGHKFSWGINDCGQLGYEKTNNEPKMILFGDNEVNTISIKEIKCGFKHSLLLSNDGDIYTFGSNVFGQLGDNSQVNRTEPIKLNISNKFINIATLNQSNS